ncbi:hypothetical protein [Arsenophonus endosymbiont of Bemisia tabaci]|uniref:hypothetical protein n=1 Tax=Arsenophonus endosymbiont of Bemisia tabaci TaxID=536059 RepID=UPI0015F3E19F|nr:hypothetical protein [Arsenophonus endosymbiont of Bemisia tabaci]CAA2929557.1 hypothetical protein ARSQ2_00655 [Arsenophonus endosymbiont of Bemisia tabaci Q2]
MLKQNCLVSRAIAGTAAISAIVAAAMVLFTLGKGGVGLAVLGLGALLAATVGGYFGYSGLKFTKK